MSDRDLESRLRAAQQTQAHQTDSGALRERVSSIPDTVEPRRRRWWHGLGLGTSRSAGLEGARVTGGTTMISAVRVAADVAVLAIGSTFALSTVSGPAEGPAPGAEAPTASEWVGVTGSGDLQLNLGAVTGVQAMSDPRVSGDVYASWRTQSERSSAIGDWTIWGAMRITNDEGMWEGEYVAFVEPDGQRNITSWMRGTAAYEDLTCFEHMHGHLGDIAITGLVYPGDIPPIVALGMGGSLPPAPALPTD